VGGKGGVGAWGIRRSVSGDKGGGGCIWKGGRGKRGEKEDGGWGVKRGGNIGAKGGEQKVRGGRSWGWKG